MKTQNKNITFFQFGFIVLLYMFFIAGYNYAQVDIKSLENSVRKTIASYYDQQFNISADATGQVTISGKVNTLFDKLKIGELISQVNQVTGIKNKLEILVDEPTADGIIKANIENEYQLNNTILEPEKIIVSVTNGIVNLSGTVSYFREKLMAQSIASWQDGVIDMTSSIKVLPHKLIVSDQNLKDLISDIMNKHFLIENNIKYDVNNGVVTLYGTAKNLYAIDHLQEEIQHLLGVKEVINQLTLSKNEE
jgi:osmotically-inducible protein OsmY